MAFLGRGIAVAAIAGMTATAAWAQEGGDVGLDLRARPGGDEGPPVLVATPGEARAGFYRDEKGRTMQVSFDLGRR